MKQRFLDIWRDCQELCVVGVIRGSATVGRWAGDMLPLDLFGEGSH